MTEFDELPFVSVVVPHLGSKENLLRCLKGLRDQTFPRDRFEILVVVNASEHDHLEDELVAGEVLLAEPNYFSYNARNFGIRKATGTIIAFTDSDTTPSSDWISEGVKTLGATKADLVAGHVEVTVAREPASAPARYELLFAFDQEKNASLGLSVTANLFVNRDAFDTYGFFEPTAISGEDFRWSLAAVDSGATIAYARAAAVHHPARESWSALFAKSRRTALRYITRDHSNGVGGGRLRGMLRFQLLTMPSPGKLARVSPTDILVARTVRLVVLAHKALCVLRITPALWKELKDHRYRLENSVLPTTPAATDKLMITPPERSRRR